MEAKDTVMDNTGIVRATWVNPNYPKDSPVMRAAKPSEVSIAQAQAEISFKLGEQEGWKLRDELAIKSIIEARLNGIREVVEWLKACSAIDEPEHIMVGISKEKWQAKLKEWGILPVAKEQKWI